MESSAPRCGQRSHSAATRLSLSRKNTSSSPSILTLRGRLPTSRASSAGYQYSRYPSTGTKSNIPICDCPAEAAWRLTPSPPAVDPEVVMRSRSLSEHLRPPSRGRQVLLRSAGAATIRASSSKSARASRQGASMSRRMLRSVLVVAVIAALVIPAAAQLPKSITLGTNPPGTVLYAAATGLARVMSGVVPFQVAVQPHSGTSTILPLIDSGEVELGFIGATEGALAYRGPKLVVGGKNHLPHSRNLRLVMRGFPFLTTILVRKDSPIRTMHDVRGKRVAGEYRANLAIWYVVFGALTTAGLTWDDVKVVPVPAVNDGVDALIQGRADVAEHGVDAAKAKEADTAVGVRVIPVDCSPEGQARLKKAVPGYYTRVLKAGSATGVVEDTCIIAYDFYLIAGKSVPDAVVENVLAAIWQNADQLPPIHPIFKEWTRERAATDDVTIPYHPGAVRFYTSRGLWKPNMQEAQNRLLAP